MKKYKLGELCLTGKIGIYGIPATAEDFSEGKVRYLRISDINDDGTINNTDKKSVSDAHIDNYILVENDIVFARTGNSTGRSYLYDSKDGKLAFAGFLIKFGIDSNKVNPKYLRYFTTSNYYKQWVKNLSSGSTRGNISAQTFADCEIIMPARKQQNLLATVLSTLDEKITLNKSINQNLEAMAKQLYDYWFVQFDFPNEKGKPYKSSGGKMVWNEKLKREIPEGWKIEKIQNIAKTYSGGTPKSTEMEYYENGNIPWINSGELNDPIITSTTNFITQTGLDNSSAKLYPRNTILIALYGATAGKVSLLSFEACSNQAICGVILNDFEMLDYTRLFLSSIYEHFITLSIGSARDNISQDTVKNIYIIVPQKDILKKFNRSIRKMTEMLVKNLVEVTTLTKQRDELLPLLMNGQVSVNGD